MDLLKMLTKNLNDKCDGKAAVIGEKNCANQEKQRRELFRIQYPQNAAPKILNLEIEIIDISMKSMRFSSINENDYFEIGKDIELEIQFGDDNIIKRTARVTRFYDGANKKPHYVCIFIPQLPADRLSKEQAFVLRNYPYFCRVLSGIQENYYTEIDEEENES